MRISSLAAVAAYILASHAQPQNSSDLPTVDLGYNVQQGSSYNDTGRYYSFNNIRYAAPPLGDLRFRAPQAPETNRSVVQNGSVGANCPSAFPSWLGTATTYIPQYLNGSTNFSTSGINTTIPATANISPSESEDCLFLDVVVPEDIFEQAGKGYGAPVLVWIYGGGYTGGSKSLYGSPAGLLDRASNDNGRGVIYVALNYRLGAFGWSAGPTFQESGGISNAALYDQRFALEWVANNIEKFGGDKNRVTVFGESAGGGSIMHQITAFGGTGDEPPFQQAILQSPGWQPLVSNYQQDQTFEQFLELLNVTTLEEARGLSTEALQTANARQVSGSAYGGFTYGPAVDGVISPQLPGQLLARGQFFKNIKVMVGHNANEGLLFSPPYYNNSEEIFEAEVKTVVPSINAWPAAVQYVADQLYPIEDYPNQIARSSAIIAEAIFTCNTFYLDKAFNNQTYSYLFAVPPAEHGNDIAYTFYNGASGSGTNETIAIALQEYITNFAQYGYPSVEGVPYFPLYQNNATIQVLNSTGIRQIMDPTANQRCNWWQKALYY
ncbi:Carboxylesterase patB [Fulvia fulva]|nr:Carboxylesterase patB [Fulvia fulva]WPV33893.1 Carboxylesterase patB [Fulvia fulva]